VLLCDIQLILWHTWHGNWVVCQFTAWLAVELCSTLHVSVSRSVNDCVLLHRTVMDTLLENMETAVVSYDVGHMIVFGISAPYTWALHGVFCSWAMNPYVTCRWRAICCPHDLEIWSYLCRSLKAVHETMWDNISAGFKKWPSVHELLVCRFEAW